MHRHSPQQRQLLVGMRLPTFRQPPRNPICWIGTTTTTVVSILMVSLLLHCSSQYHLVESYITTTRTTTTSSSSKLLFKNELLLHQNLQSTITTTAQSRTTGKRRTLSFDRGIRTHLQATYLSQLVSGAIVDERFDMRLFPGPLRGIGTIPTIVNPYDVYKTIRPNTKIATIPAQNVFLVSNFRRDKYDYKQLVQQQQQQQQRKIELSYKDFSMWDRDLAILLWKEYLTVVQQKKSVTLQPSQKSPLTGYIEYLCQQDTFTQQENNPYYELYDDNFYIIPLQEVDIDTYVPPSTAPHTLRRWSSEQKSILLSQYERGQELIQISNLQEQIWRIKYESIRMDPSCHNDQNIRMSYTQFVWAMEVVHSRAFCGLPIIVLNDENDGPDSSITTSSPSSSNWKKILKSVLPGIVAPLFAATIGYVYAISTLYPNEIVLMILAMLGAVPLLLQLFQSVTTTVSENVVVPSIIPFSSQSSSTRYKNVDQSAVLLPIIDSANHSPDAMKDTNIVYNPLQHTFEWMIGPKSFIESSNVVRPPLRRQPLSFETAVPTMTITSDDLVPSTSLQVCISYGKQPKSDIEWMINYGFLPGVSIDADIDNFDQYRYFLSQQFLERNP